MKTLVVVLAALLVCTRERMPAVEDGSELWLRYRLVSDTARLAEYRAAISELVITSNTPTQRVT